jgi:hypothetical protein
VGSEELAKKVNGYRQRSKGLEKMNGEEGYIPQLEDS